MVVVIISKINWNVQTIRNVTSITLSSGTYTIVGDSTVTASAETHIVRIMG